MDFAFLKNRFVTSSAAFFLGGCVLIAYFVSGSRPSEYVEAKNAV
ncbi:MAG: hypothetical protein RL235_53, partial [Chlamydiota bacterium]